MQSSQGHKMLLRFGLYLFLGYVFSYAQALTPITLQLAWKYQFQFAGYIMAKEKGFYEQAGLDVMLKEYELDTEVNREVLSGKAHFGIARSDLVLDRLNEGMKFVQLLALCQASPVIFQTLKRNDITKLEDLKDKRFVLTGDSLLRDGAEVVSMLHSVGIDENKIHKVNGTTYGPEDIINGNGDVITAYSTITPYHLQKLGYESISFHPKDYGFDFYSDILFTMEEFIVKNPEIVSKFYEASMKGWLYAFSHIDETIDTIKAKYDSQELPRDLLEFEAHEFKKLAFMPNIPFGDINVVKIEKIVNSFRFLGLTKNPSNAFEPFIYDHPSKKTVTLPFDWSLFWKIVWGILFVIMALIINQWAIMLYNRKLKNKEVVLKKEHGELQEQVNRDSLTLLYNRRYMMESAKHLIALSKRHNEHLSIMMIDIDNFKIINDTYGHGAGDSVIKAIARAIKLCSRKSDIASRFGGEEFLLLLPNTSLEGAKVIGEKIRQEIEELKVPLANHFLMVTVSIGLSPIDIDYHEVLNENFWQLADDALYEAKRTGKNRVVVKDRYKEEVDR